MLPVYIGGLFLGTPGATSNRAQTLRRVLPLLIWPVRGARTYLRMIQYALSPLVDAACVGFILMLFGTTAWLWWRGRELSLS